MLATAIVGGVGSVLCGLYARSLWRHPERLRKIASVLMSLLAVLIAVSSMSALVQAF
jgi:hypothetical protein